MQRWIPLKTAKNPSLIYKSLKLSDLLKLERAKGIESCLKIFIIR